MEGSRRPPGQNGVRGKQGETGSTGAAGTPGEDGNTVLSGVDAPAATVGKNGHFLVDTFAAIPYGPKSPSGWGVAASLVGARGAPGNDGADGEQGDTGPQGEPGKGTNWSIVQNCATV